MINFNQKVSEYLQKTEEKESHIELNPYVFHASQVGFCKRQLYNSKLGLQDHDATTLGIFEVGNMIHHWMETRIANELPNCQFEHSLDSTIDVVSPVSRKTIQLDFTGTCDCWDMENDAIYDFKTRSGWYSFSPPKQRHLDQILIYMEMSDVRKGQVVYISKKDMSIRTYPEDGFFEYDKQRTHELKMKCAKIAEKIVQRGYPQSRHDIPFDKCGCFFCNQETLTFDHLPDDDSIIHGP